jgi:hypothetical protein
VHGGVRRDLLHHIRSPSERADREAVPHRLGHHRQVSVDSKVCLRPARTDPEPGDHLVEDEQCSSVVAEASNQLQEPWRCRDHTAVARQRLHDHRCNFRPMTGERLAHRRLVVPFDCDKFRDRRRRLAGGLWRDRREVAGRGKDRVEPAVVVTREFDDQWPSGCRPCGAQRAVDGLRSRESDADALETLHTGTQALRQFHLRLVLGSGLL